MSRKHFIAIAANIRNQVEATRAAKYSDVDKATILGTVSDIANNLCRVFADANPAFNRGRFLAACGLD